MNPAPPVHAKTCSMCQSAMHPNGYCIHCDQVKECRKTCVLCERGRHYQGVGPRVARPQ